MILEMYSVYDAAVKAFTPPMFFRSRGEALRSFTEAANDEKSNIWKYAKDYSFMFIGEFDDGSGTFLTQLPVRVISAHEVTIFTDPLQPPSVADVREGLSRNGSGLTR